VRFSFFDIRRKGTSYRFLGQLSGIAGAEESSAGPLRTLVVVLLLFRLDAG
jgi:hypothetical protein